jgi:hypothetical protein
MLRTSLAAIAAFTCFFANAIVNAQPSPPTSGAKYRDCGVAWSCFEQSLDQGQPAIIRVSTGNNGGGQEAPPQILLRTNQFDGTSVTTNFDLGGVAASCRLSRAALRGIVEDAAAMGNLSPLDFGIANRCQGPMFGSWWPATHNVVASLPAVIAKPVGYADCGWSTTCLVNHIRTKMPAAGRQLTVLPLFGLTTTTVSYVQVDGFNHGMTAAFIRTDQNTAVFDADSIQAMKAKGTSYAEIRKVQAKASASAASAVGLQGTCRMKDTTLVDLLHRWYDGSYSSNDWDHAETCTGKMFANWHKGT